MQPVVGLRNASRIEGIGLDDVGARFQKSMVNVADHVRPGQRQQIVVALDIAGVVAQSARFLTSIVGLVELARLDHRAHGAIENQNPLLEQFGEKRCLVIGHVFTNKKPVQLAAERVLESKPL